MVFVFLFVLFFCFVCLRPVSCVPNIGSVSGLSVFDCSFGLFISCILIFLYNVLTASSSPGNSGYGIVKKFLFCKFD